MIFAIGAIIALTLFSAAIAAMEVRSFSDFVKGFVFMFAIFVAMPLLFVLAAEPLE